MSVTITAKLNDNAGEFAAGESTGFGIRLGVQYYDRETKNKEWTNYEAALFSNNQNQIDFMRSALIKGAVIEVTAQQLKIKVFDGQNGQKISLEMIDAKLGYVHTGEQAPQQAAPQQAAPYQPSPQQTQPQQQQAPQQQPAYRQPQHPTAAMGYFYQDGTPMPPQEAQRYFNAGIQEWGVGVTPPALPTGY